MLRWLLTGMLYLKPLSEMGETGGKSATRISGFEVPKTSNFRPRTLVRLTHPAFLACLAGLARITFHASRFTVPIQQAPLPLMTAAGVARRILMSAQSDCPRA